ncbi:MAG: hypothetical protein KIC80_01395 [Brachyspira sp.]|jgi:hypothetical protein|nr:hypothetical protein [Brachyspira sp.]
MKKVLSALFMMLMLAFGQSALAKNVPVVAMSDYVGTNPPQAMAVKVGSNIQVTDDIVLFEGYVVKGKIVVNKNGTFSFIPYSFINFHNEETKFEPQAYATFAGMVVNNKIVAAKAPLTIKTGQAFALNFTEVQPKQQQQVENVSGTASDIVNTSYTPATEESQRPFSRYLPGLPLTDLSTFDSCNRYNPAMPLNNILRNNEFLR